MKKFLLAVWQFPQAIGGLILWAWLKASKKLSRVETYRDRTYLIGSGVGFGVSLGPIVVLDEKHDKTTWDHEYGHTVQSLYFGPLYLLVVGIPSAVFNNLWDRLFHKKWSYKDRVRWYYSRYPEKFADFLGDVERSY